jgi:hypothetical protein
MIASPVQATGATSSSSPRPIRPEISAPLLGIFGNDDRNPSAEQVNQTEAELVEALDGLRGDRTLLFVAHRLSTVRHCDRVLVVEGARITDVGAFDELARSHPLFAAMRTTPSMR